MMFLLIMRSRSYLREAITAFLRAEVLDSEMMTVERVEDIDGIPGETLGSIRLVLIHVDHEPADGSSVVSTIARVRRCLNGTPIVLLGDSADSGQFRRALESGTNGYIPEDTPADIVKHVLPIIANGGIYAPPFVFASCPDAAAATSAELPFELPPELRPDKVAPPPRSAKLAEAFTRREAEVLALLGEGLPNKLIAHRLDLKEGTVKVHVRHVMKKLNVTSRTQAALFAQKRNSVLLS